MEKESTQEDKLVLCIHKHMWIIFLPVVLLMFVKYWLGIVIAIICLLLVYYSQKKANML